jgi:TetR/AcrR family transcriptional regulator, cholesterol catabolism regulator
MRDRIIKTALDLFRRYGIKSVTVDDIAREAGMSKKTIYQYFKEKDELVLVCAEVMMQADYDAISQIEQQSSDMIESLIRLADYFKTKFTTTNPTLLLDIRKHHPVAWERFLEFKEKYYLASLQRSLERGIAEGIFRSDMHLEVMCRMRMEMVQMGFDPSIFPPDKFSTAEVQAQFFEHFMQGILTDKGRKLLAQYQAERASS